MLTYPLPSAHYIYISAFTHIIYACLRSKRRTATPSFLVSMAHHSSDSSSCPFLPAGQRPSRAPQMPPQLPAVRPRQPGGLAQARSLISIDGSNLIAMASTLSLVDPSSDGLQPNRNGLHLLMPINLGKTDGHDHPKPLFDCTTSRPATCATGTSCGRSSTFVRVSGGPVNPMSEEL